MHTIEKFYKNHYLVICKNCKSSFHVHKKSIKFSNWVYKPKRSRVTIKPLVCPGCSCSALGESSKRHWFPSRMPRIEPFPCCRDITCNFGKIAHMQLYAPGKNYLYFSSSTVGHLRGTFLSEDNHFKVTLSEFCDQHESNYVLKPFSILIRTKEILLYRLSDVCLCEPKPFVFLNVKEDYGLLSRSCDFTARVSYLDPIFAISPIK